METKIQTTYKELETEVLKELEATKPTVGLKNVDNFKNKVLYALNKVEDIIQTETEPIFKISYGNQKLPKSTIIVSCGSWFNCYGKKTGLCDICQYCYDKYVEIMYKDTLASRFLKEVLFRSYDSDILSDHINKECKKNTLLCRFNEVGELRNDTDLKKVVDISNNLFEVNGIKSYIYTHNNQLNFNIDRPNLIMNGSDFMVDNEYKVLTEDQQPNKNWIECICDCNNCNKCSLNKGQIIFEDLRK